MTIKTFHLSCICLLMFNQAWAQVDIIKKAIKQVNSYGNMSYMQESRQKNPFSGEWGSIDLQCIVSHTATDTVQELYIMRDSRGYQTVYNGSVLIEVDQNDKTYELRDKEKANGKGFETPFSWARLITKKLKTGPKQIKQLPDTLVGGKKNFHIQLIMTDSAENREAYDLVFDKVTYLPVYTQQYLQGYFGKGDLKDNTPAVMITERNFKDYKVNLKNIDAIISYTIPVDYTPAKKLPLLSVGQKAPIWQLSNVNGMVIRSDQYLGSVTLMDFSFNACAACKLAIPMFNKLHEKYKSGGVNIITINTSDTRESVINFNKKNNIKYPVLINGIGVSKDFHVSAYPSYFLIDKQGNIAASFEGYSEKLESEIIKQIDNLF